MKQKLSLGDLAPNKGARRNRKRIGRGPGSGTGKTAGKGHKGQKARSGWSMPTSFEGGQMPLVRRLPKFGFKAPFRVEYKAVNIGLLDKFDDGATVDAAALKGVGLADGRKPIKILGKGALTKKLTVKAASFSDSAKKAIEAAGGTAEVASNLKSKISNLKS